MDRHELFIRSRDTRVSPILDTSRPHTKLRSIKSRDSMFQTASSGHERFKASVKPDLREKKRENVIGNNRAHPWKHPMPFGPHTTNTNTKQVAG